MRWARHVEYTAEMKNVYKISAGKPQGRRQHGIPRRRWEDNIKTDLK
jgi:hypothetical protein